MIWCVVWLLRLFREGECIFIILELAVILLFVSNPIIDCYRDCQHYSGKEPLEIEPMVEHLEIESMITFGSVH
jgi:hypothetical protein